MTYLKTHLPCLEELISIHEYCMIFAEAGAVSNPIHPEENMIAKKLSDRSKILLTAIFILALLAGQFTPATADDDGPSTVHVTYVKGQTPVFGDSGAVKKDVPAQKVPPPSNNKSNSAICQC